ncbi:hypothetical protein [Chryseobacterium indoltheticum]
MANLLARFMMFRIGQILIDDTDIKHLKLTDYRKLLENGYPRICIV